MSTRLIVAKGLPSAIGQHKIWLGYRLRNQCRLSCQSLVENCPECVTRRLAALPLLGVLGAATVSSFNTPPGLVFAAAFWVVVVQAKSLYVPMSRNSPSLSVH
jgi:hypothetical protein